MRLAHLRENWRLLGVARIGLGAVFLIRTTALVNVLPIPLARVRGPFFGWPYAEIGWPMAWGNLVLPDRVRALACVLRTVAAVLFLVGIRARVAGVVAGALGLVAMSQDPFGFIFTLYVLFVGTIVLASTDATSKLALRPDHSLDPRSSATLVRLVVATIYGWAAVAKMHRGWLGGTTLTALAEDGLLTHPVANILVQHPGLSVVAAWGTMLAELAVAAALLSARTRLTAIALALVMHVGFELAARPDVMGWVMASLLVACAATNGTAASSPMSRNRPRR